MTSVHSIAVRVATGQPPLPQRIGHKKTFVINFDRSKFTTRLAGVPAGRTRREESRFREQAQQLAARLRALRTDRGMTQEQLATQAQVAVSTLRKIESGRVVEPGFFTMLSLASALGIELQDFSQVTVSPIQH
ncbi:helix-turn-helix transcriptional regulator [Actinoplanes sp. NPDC023801]|uniref:helix-turn-helix domain-containing protein n=1 Tax=Actinoplanes sp. NPDC023801 TaxID=3154595 RepID=UPI0033BFF4D8